MGYIKAPARITVNDLLSVHFILPLKTTFGQFVPYLGVIV